MQPLHDALVERQQVSRAQERVRARPRLAGSGGGVAPGLAGGVHCGVDLVELGQRHVADGVGRRVQRVADGVRRVADGSCGARVFFFFFEAGEK